MKAVDISFDALSAEEAQCLRGAGIELVIQCLWTATLQPVVRIQNLEMAARNGLLIAGYISVNRSRSGRSHVDAARIGLPEDLWRQLRFVAIDIELRGILDTEIEAACDYVVSLGARAPIYTAKGAWEGLIVPPNSTRLSTRGFPLWNAAWDMYEDIDYPRARFGGWRDDQVIGEQWSGGSIICGAHVDRNTFSDEYVKAGLEDDMGVDQELRDTVGVLALEQTVRNEIVALLALAQAATLDKNAPRLTQAQKERLITYLHGLD